MIFITVNFDFIKSDNRYQVENSKHVLKCLIKYLEKKHSSVRTAVDLSAHTYEFKVGDSINLLNGYLIPNHLILMKVHILMKCAPI